jgi:hypothetical protein
MRMRIFKALCVATVAIVVAMVASSAQAVVAVDASAATHDTTQVVGSTIDGDIGLTWNGTDSMVGVFASRAWEGSQLELINADSTTGTFEARSSTTAGRFYAPSMTTFGPIASGLVGYELSNAARTVQYGGLTPIPTDRGRPNHEVQLTFQLVGADAGAANITSAIRPGDISAPGASIGFGSRILAFIGSPIPKSGTVLLMGLGLLGFAGTGRSNG